MKLVGNWTWKDSFRVIALSLTISFFVSTLFLAFSERSQDSSAVLTSFPVEFGFSKVAVFVENRFSSLVIGVLWNFATNLDDSWKIQLFVTHEIWEKIISFRKMKLLLEKRRLLFTDVTPWEPLNGGFSITFQKKICFFCMSKKIGSSRGSNPRIARAVLSLIEWSVCSINFSDSNS